MAEKDDGSVPKDGGPAVQDEILSTSSPMPIHDIESTLKVIEISAQEIVDRISNSRPSSSDLKSSSQHKALLGTRGRTVSESVISSGKSSAASYHLSSPNHSPGSADSNLPGSIQTIFEDGNEKKGSQDTLPTGTVSPSRPLGSKDKKEQHLLSTIQKWVKGVAEKEAKSSHDRLEHNLWYLPSVESYIRTLEPASQELLVSKFSSHLVNWLINLFKFRDGLEGETGYNSVLPHWEQLDGILAITKWHLHIQFPNLRHNGYDTFIQEDTLSIVYCCDEDIGIHITSLLGLSKECFSLVDTSSEDWVSGLEQLILLDRKRNLVPIILLLNIGKTTHYLESACHVAEANNVPVHIYGRNTFSYLVKRPETDQIGYSFTIELKYWIPSPPLPYLTIFKKQAKVDTRKLQFCGLTSIHSGLLAIAPWFCAELSGHSKVRSIVDEICDKGQFLFDLFNKYDQLSIIPNWSILSNDQTIVSLLTFRFNPPSQILEDESQEQQPSESYINVLNSWLFHILERDVRNQLYVEFVQVSKTWYIALDIFKTKKLNERDREFIENVFDHHMHVLLSTVSKKPEFGRLLAESKELEWVDYESSWAGLGAVRYIPKFYREDAAVGIDSKVPPSVPPNEDPLAHRKSNINHLNAQIVDKLKSIDNAFSLGIHGDGTWCVQFGMVTEETEVSELLRLVITTGEEIEESSEFFHQMSELVKKGIQMATEELKRESEEALWEEGILRRVPVVGTFVNWFSPPARETGIRGRALNLVQGKVESTENIYKYHMQVESPSSPTPSSTAILNRFGTPRGSLSK